MNIILVPGKRGRAQNACFSQRHLLVFAFVALIGLPAFFGALTYRIHDMLARAAGEAAWRQTSRQNTATTPSPSHNGPNSQAAAARAK